MLMVQQHKQKCMYVSLCALKILLYTINHLFKPKAYVSGNTWQNLIR